jgi:hypothetical protein
MTPTKQTLVIALAVIVVVTMTASVASSYRSDADHSRASSDPQRENDRGRLANGDNPRDCQTGAALAPPFRGLITFHEGARCRNSVLVPARPRPCVAPATASGGTSTAGEITRLVSRTTATT